MYPALPHHVLLALPAPVTPPPLPLPPPPLLQLPPVPRPRRSPSLPRRFLLDRLRPLERRVPGRPRWCVPLDPHPASPPSCPPGTVVATLVSPIGSYFNKSQQSSYLGTSYLLSVCCFTPLYGPSGDRRPRLPLNSYQVVYQTSWVGRAQCFSP